LKFGISTSWDTQGLSRFVEGLLFLYLYLYLGIKRMCSYY